MTDSLAAHLDELDSDYARLHTAKEDAFWTAKMGLGADGDQSQAELDEKEIALQRFLSDPARLRKTRELSSRANGGDEQLRARGWLSTLEAHALPSAEARALQEELTAAEGRLENARRDMPLGYTGADGFVRASSIELGNMMVVDGDEARRKAAFEGLRSIERYVIEHGFLEIVRKRNQLGRLLGAEDYYDWKTRRVEGMSKAELFALLDELEVLTRDAAARAVETAYSKWGRERFTPWNYSYLVAGDSIRETDPYFPFRDAIERWGRSFSALGIRYQGADLVLDLLDRRGKYENGFMHGPVVGWRRHGERIPARIQFTANALPGVVGSGSRALKTLFHEGGHAAHFANIDMPSPCFGQEFAPTSTAFAETQSMFCDSLLEDADWQQRYALDGNGRALPWELMERAIDSGQPFAAWTVRSMLAVCYGEKAIYELPESELTLEGIQRALREVERRLLLLEEGSPRPTLSIPHLISGESSAYYHGYVLARMAVYQARAHFIERDGHLVDNPRIGPELARVWWQPGNSVTFTEFVRRLTGAPLTALHWSNYVNQSAEERKQSARASLARLESIPVPGARVELDAKISVVHGREKVATLSGDFQAFCAEFAAFIDEQAAQRIVTASR
jgi:hypothetical protein